MVGRRRMMSSLQSASGWSTSNPVEYESRTFYEARYTFVHQQQQQQQQQQQHPVNYANLWAAVEPNFHHSSMIHPSWSQIDPSHESTSRNHGTIAQIDPSHGSTSRNHGTIAHNSSLGGTGTRRNRHNLHGVNHHRRQGFNRNNLHGVVHQIAREDISILPLRNIIVDGVMLLDDYEVNNNPPLRIHSEHVSENFGFSEDRNFINQDMNIRDTNQPNGPHRVHQTALGPRTIFEDMVDILDHFGSSDGTDSINQHMNLQLDTDDMPYEELLALGEMIGMEKSGLSEETILSNMKTRIHVASETSSHWNEPRDVDKETEICIVCQAEYENQEKIGTLDCGHEYHVDCIKQWLLEKNVCPICKRPALNARGKQEWNQWNMFN
ncbi:zinc finger protein [Macleaya cordata]|uniref:RING-type E3 ubiquitin transferase n=1 Tax=Macleaya cordata TaxID=56857 RepID=A0A200QVH8_MACCD|nr:zinc finger protein [Macleaya cordata]